jgi:hypothetical protein
MLPERAETLRQLCVWGKGKSAKAIHRGDEETPRRNVTYELNKHSPAQLAIISRLHRVHGVGHCRLVALNFRPVGGWQYQDRQLPSAKVLLIPQILIRRDKNFKSPLGLAQQVRRSQDWTIPIQTPWTLRVARERDAKGLVCLDRRERA